MNNHLNVKKLDHRLHNIGLIMVILFTNVIEFSGITKAKLQHFDPLCLSVWHTDYCDDLSGYNYVTDPCAIQEIIGTKFCDFSTNHNDVSCQNCNFTDCTCNNDISCDFDVGEENPSHRPICVYKGYKKLSFDSCYTNETEYDDEHRLHYGHNVEDTLYYTTIINMVLLLLVCGIVFGYWLLKNKKLRKKKNMVLLGFFTAITCINVIHVVCNLIFVTELNTNGITCYSSAYYLVVEGRSMYLGISLIDCAISGTLVFISILEVKEEEHLDDRKTMRMGKHREK